MQHIVNSGYDIHDRASGSTITNYDPKDGATVIDTQAISYLEYDRYGNALQQNILTTGSDGQKTFKAIVNTYDPNNKKSQMKGTAQRSETNRYSGDAAVEANLIERTVTTTDEYDNKGNAVRQTSQTYVRFSAGVLKLQKEVKTYNQNIDARGDAHIQNITTSETDNTGDAASLEVTSYQVIENRSFDLGHNSTNQRIVTYSDDTATKELKDVQEIRATKGFTSSGTAIEQVIATYADYDGTAVSGFIEAKVITNKDVDSQGNVGESVIVAYSAAPVIQASGTGDIALSGDPVTRQTIVTSSFDNRGNSLDQRITKDAYISGAYVTSEVQHIVNSGYDIHDRASGSTITNYDPKDGATVIDTQAISYLEYDRYGNALQQNILTTGSDGQKTFKAIVNTYDPNNKKSQMKGTAQRSETNRYSGDAAVEANLIERTVTTTDEYDNKGNAVRQTSQTYVRFSAGVLKLQKEVKTYNQNIDARGDAHIQNITTSETDNTGDAASLEVTSYQVIENRSFDLGHNSTNQRIVTYSDDTATKELKDVQEIRATKGFTSSGTAIEQVIATYADYDGTAVSGFIEAKVISNKDVDSQGNVGESVIVAYSAAPVIQASGTGDITLSGDPVTRQTIVTSSFDNRGNSLDQRITKDAYISGAYVTSEVQHIVNSGYDIHDRASGSTITNYDPKDGATVIDTQAISYLEYDRYGNALQQNILTTGSDGQKTFKTITNAYDPNNKKSQMKGTAQRSETNRYSGDAAVEANLIERTVTTTDEYDNKGNAVRQTSQTYVRFSAGVLRAPKRGKDL